VLRQLHISGLGVIDDLDLELHPGLNVLTGETGAGKTMITVGLALALGGRGGASLVREGYRAARVQARFDAPTGAGDWVEDGEVILARSVGSDGRSTARIGGQLATVSSLAELGSALVEVHGQHQAGRLLTSAAQTAFLDRFAGEQHLLALAAYQQVFRERRATAAELAMIRDAARERERELDLLAYQTREIQAADPRAGECEELELEESRLAHVERLTELAATADAEVAADGGASDALAAAASATDAAAALDPAAAELAARVRGLSTEANELARDLRSYGSSLQVDPGRLQEVRERIALLKGLQRKYGASDADVLAFLAEASERMAGLEGADERLEALESEVAELDGRARESAKRVSRGRLAAATPLAAAVTAELGELGMPGASVLVELDALADPGPDGNERAEVRLCAGPAQPVLPLAKAASGGELSRTMLACRSVLADLDEVPTLVFDEIDAGIGGEAGLAVGRRLAGLATDRQVVVVTHLPQIACFADLHARVRKQRGTTSLKILVEEERVRELSRMLAGMPGSDSASSHAAELLTRAARARQASPA
jgi:DNA repair protein RecN (Recombination protein N)